MIRSAPKLLTDAAAIETALTRVGELLAADGQSYGVVIVGGAALNLLGVVARSTRDVDIMAVRGTVDVEEPPVPLPPSLVRAINAVATRLELPPDWLNTGPALQWKQGLPPGFVDRITWRRYGALTVGLAGRRDLIFFKLYAAADDPYDREPHYRDLLALAPSAQELADAETWTRQQDPSPAFAFLLDRVLRNARRERQT